MKKVVGALIAIAALGASVAVFLVARLDADTLGQLVLEHELWPLLRRRVVVRRLLVESPTLTLVSQANGDASSGRDRHSAPRPDPGSALTSGAGSLDIDGVLGTTVFFEVGGTMAAPQVAIDMGRIQAAAQVAARGRVDDAVEKEKKKLKK
ncbi:MAG: hypothetical protein VYE73_01845 [Acidobacteriota bacterium]|nr:hypothetical protein [Acidobacteriota bacterium]